MEGESEYHVVNSGPECSLPVDDSSSGVDSLLSAQVSASSCSRTSRKKSARDVKACCG